MVTEFDYPAWIVLAFGIYALAAGIGELRSPGFWERMAGNLHQLPALRFLTGLVCIAIGTALYLIEPWGRADWMLHAVKIVGAWMVVEGALFLAVGDWFIAFAKRLMGAAPRLWAILSILIGIGLIVAAELRI